MKDAFNTELTIGDPVAFVYGVSSNTLRRGMVTGVTKIRGLTFLQIVESSPDGTTTTFQIHPAQVAKLS